MLRRFFAFLVVGALLLAVGYLFYLNPAIVEFRLSSTRSFSFPLPLLLLASFLAGAGAIFMLALFRETQWTVAERLRKRREARAARIRDAVATGRSLLWHGRADHGKRVLRKAPAESRGVESVLLLAENAIAADRLDEARTALEEGLALHPADPRMLALLADVHLRVSDWRTATGLLERAAAIEPDSPRVVASLRDSYVHERRWPEALHAEDVYLGLVRRPADVTRERRRQLGLRYELAMARETTEESIRDLYALLRSDPAFVPAAVSLGDLLRGSGRAAEAGRVWLRAARSRPEPVLLARIESVYRELGRSSKVSALYRTLRQRSEHDWLIPRHARFLLESGDAEAAALELRAAGTAQVDGVAVQLLRGEIERRRGHAEVSLAAFAEAVESASDGSRRAFCTECGRAAAQWESRCAGCGQWDVLTAQRP